MREIVAIIRPQKERETKEALEHLGYAACTTLRVLGRGRQRGLKYWSLSLRSSRPIEPVVSKYLPKKLLYLVVGDRQVKPAVQAILRVNRTGQFGDGKIFVLPCQSVYRVRTTEVGEAVLQ